MEAREVRFEIRFDPDAVREYQKLDNSVLKIVNKKLEDLEERADIIGKALSWKKLKCAMANFYEKLFGTAYPKCLDRIDHT